MLPSSIKYESLNLYGVSFDNLEFRVHACSLSVYVLAFKCVFCHAFKTLNESFLSCLVIHDSVVVDVYAGEKAY